MASSVPSVTSDLSGFGDYLLRHMPEHDAHGMFVVERGKRTFDWSARQLHLSCMYSSTSRDVTGLCNATMWKTYSAAFDLEKFDKHYAEG